MSFRLSKSYSFHKSLQSRQDPDRLVSGETQTLEPWEPRKRHWLLIDPTLCAPCPFISGGALVVLMYTDEWSTEGWPQQGSGCEEGGEEPVFLPVEAAAQGAFLHLFLPIDPHHKPEPGCSPDTYLPLSALFLLPSASLPAAPSSPFHSRLSSLHCGNRLLSPSGSPVPYILFLKCRLITASHYRLALFCFPSP